MKRMPLSRVAKEHVLERGLKPVLSVSYGGDETAGG